jgi:hypothetical protein
MRNLFRDYILSNGGSFHDLNDILAGRFGDGLMAKRCAQDLADLCTLMLVELEVADEWLWLFLPVGARQPAPGGGHRHLRTAPAKPASVKPLPSGAPVEPCFRHRLQADRVFYLHDPLTGRIDWLFESREGLQGPFATKPMAEKALAEFVRASGGRGRESEPSREPHAGATRVKAGGKS